MGADGDTDEDVLPWSSQAGMIPSGAARKIKHLKAEREQMRKDKESFSCHSK